MSSPSSTRVAMASGGHVFQRNWKKNCHDIPQSQALHFMQVGYPYKCGHLWQATVREVSDPLAGFLGTVHRAYSHFAGSSCG